MDEEHLFPSVGDQGPPGDPSPIQGHQADCIARLDQGAMLSEACRAQAVPSREIKSAKSAVAAQASAGLPTTPGLMEAPAACPWSRRITT